MTQPPVKNEFSARWHSLKRLVKRKFFPSIREKYTRRKKQSQRLRAFFHEAPASFCIMDLDGAWQDFNKGFTRLVGYEASELRGRKVYDFLHPNDRVAAQIEIERARRGSSQVTLEMRFVCRDGSMRLLTFALFADLAGGSLFGVARDLSEIQADESENMLEEAQRVAKIGSWFYDLVSGDLRWSRQMFELFPEDPVHGPPDYERHISTIHPEDQEKTRRAVAQCAAEGTPFSLQFRSVFPDGRHIWIQAYGDARVDREGRVVGMRGTCQDVSELVQAEERLQFERAKAMQSSKLASLGEIAAGVAHEINNPLTIISGNLRLLPRYFNDHETLQKKIETLQKATERIARIVRGLRKFYGSAEGSVQRPHVLQAIVREALVLTGAKATRHATSVFLALETEAMILCDEIEIEQVIVNLINNSIDAVIGLSSRWVKVLVFEDGPSVVLQVRDSGNGVGVEFAEKLFQPFFTTKAVGEGMGLGLSIVKGILDDHKANIEVKIVESHTCFEIKFIKYEAVKNAV